MVGPEQRNPELDTPTDPARTVAEQLTAGLRRDGSQQLAVDTSSLLDVRAMTTRQVRAERDRPAKLLREAPPDYTRLVAHTGRLCEDAEQGWGDTTAAVAAARGRLAELGQGTGRLLHRRELARAREWLALAEAAAELARQRADRAADREREARHVQQLRDGWLERHPDALLADRVVTRELGWRSRVHARLVELEPPEWARELGDPPTSVRGGRVWRQATTLLSAYRDRYGVTDPERALGPEPRRADVVQRQAWLDARQPIERVHAKQRIFREQRLDRRERAHGDQPPTRPARSDRTRWPSTEERERRGREREAG